MPSSQVELRSPKLGDRSLFPDLELRCYLNHAAISAPSLAVVQAANRVLSDYARRGLQAFFGWKDQRDRLRGKLARLVGVRADDIGLTPNTTSGIIDVALCFPWHRRDRVILFVGEFPANVTPWQRAAELFDLEITMLPLSDYASADEPGLARLTSELSSGVRMVAVSAVQFQTGLRMPLERMADICHAAGAEIFVDAVQACGAVPLDAGKMGVDYLSSGSHKWLMGLEGAGFLYVRPDRVAALRPHVAGWLSHEDGVRFLIEGESHLRYDRPVRKRADFVEGGNANAVGCAALEASLDSILALGPVAIHAHVNDYIDVLEAGLVERGFRSLRAAQSHRRSCILGVIPPAAANVVVLHAALMARGVSCSIPDGVLRFAPHWPNHADEIEHVLASVDASLEQARR